MKLLVFFVLLALAAAAPTSDDVPVVVTEEFFPDSLAVYTSEHEIVSLTVPLNSANFKDDENLDDALYNLITIFVEADVNDKGEKDYKGLYVLKEGKATKILETGTDSASDNTDSEDVFLSATDGVYVYHAATQKVEKYGSVSGNFIAIVKPNSTEDLIVLSNDHSVYKVTQNGEKTEKVNDIPSAREIVLDFSDNLYFFGDDKVPYVVNADGVKKIDGLPSNPTSVSLIKPPFVIDEGVIFRSDDKTYVIYSNGKSEFAGFVLQAKPSAYAMETTFMDYFAYNKKIYEYNIRILMLGSLLEDIKGFLESKIEEIQSIATHSRGGLKF